MKNDLTRREIIRVGLLAMAGSITGLKVTGKSPSTAVTETVRNDGLVRLPDRGTLYAASDFHSRFADFATWLRRTKLVEKIRNGEDIYGVILGDAVDMKPGDPEAEPGGDLRIVQKIRDLQASLPSGKDRLIYLAGNHEDRCIRIYDKLKKEEGMTPKTQKKILGKLFEGENARYYSQFNFLQHMTDDLREYLAGRPVVLLTGNGVVGVHAGPSLKMTAVQEIVSRNDPVIQELLWNRANEIKKGGYTRTDLIKFLQIMDNAGLMISGHTPLEYLPEKYIMNNIGCYEQLQVILGTSYGHEPCEKSFLKLDLAKRYRECGALVPGREIMGMDPSGVPVKTPGNVLATPIAA